MPPYFPGQWISLSNRSIHSNLLPLPRYPVASQDAMQVVRNVVFDPRMLPGGGATELAIAHAISKSVNDIEGD